jgi:hypothetical protein
MPLLLARAGKELVPLGRYFFDLMLKVARLLPVIDPAACFVSADLQLNETIGDRLGNSTFFGRKHCSISLKKGLLWGFQHRLIGEVSMRNNSADESINVHCHTKFPERRLIV